MAWWDVALVLGVIGCLVGLTGAVFTVVRALPWGKQWDVGGYQ